MLQLLAFLETKTLHDFGHAIGGAKVAHEIVLEADVKARAPGIALARTTAAELPVDPARFVTFGADHKKTAAFRHTFAEFNVGAAARHVRRDRDSAGLASALDDFGLLHVYLCV